jgi:hypothetical protein
MKDLLNTYRTFDHQNYTAFKIIMNGVCRLFDPPEIKEEPAWTIQYLDNYISWEYENYILKNSYEITEQEWKLLRIK